LRKNSWNLNHPVLRLLQHLFFWALSFLVFLQIVKSGPRPEKVDFVYTLLFQLSLAPAVYLNLKWLLPQLGNRKKILGYIILLMAAVFFFSRINYNFFEKWSAKLLPDYFFISYYTFKEIVLFFLVYILITTLLKLSKSWFLVSELQKELLEKEKQKTEIELKALKAQINPHFFFNTLNNIYSMALDRDERLPATVLQLSDLMRYFLYESKDHFVPLEKELIVIKDYIALQKIRKGEKLKIEFTCSGEVNEQQIAPLLLITFLENAFKHGASDTKEAFINSEIIIAKNQLRFMAENSMGMADKIKEKEYHGLGLENIRRQLELLYPGKHSLDIEIKQNSYRVQLQLEL
jgi:sensor histidine kinase YesM